MASVCRAAVQDLRLRKGSARGAPKPDAAKLEVWRRGLRQARISAASESAWEQATRLLAKLELAQEGLWAVDASEIEDFLMGHPERRAEFETGPKLGSGLADACAEAERHLSLARELASKLDRALAAEGGARGGKGGLSSDIGELVEEISMRVERATSEAKDELSKLED